MGGEVREAPKPNERVDHKETKTAAGAARGTWAREAGGGPDVSRDEPKVSRALSFLSSGSAIFRVDILPAFHHLGGHP